MQRATTSVRVLDLPQASRETIRLLEEVRVHGVVVVLASKSGGREDVIVVLEAGRTASARTPDDLKDPQRMVLLCGTFEATRMSALIGEGVWGVVLLEEAEKTLLPTVAAVAAGQICFPRPPAATVRPVLSIREKQVIGLVALGLSNGEIAERLFVAESTVKSHLTSAFAKLGVRSRHEATDLLVNPESGLGLGFLSLVPESD